MNLRFVILLAFILVSGLFSYPALALDPRCPWLLTYFNSDEADRVSTVLEKMAREHVDELKYQLEKNKGNPDLTLTAIGKVYLDHVMLSLPENLYVPIGEMIDKAEISKQQSPSKRKAENLEGFKKDPIGTFIETRKEMADLTAHSHERMLLSRELRGNAVTATLDLLSEINRIEKYETKPYWQKVNIISIFNPLPSDTLQRYKQYIALSQMQWDYLSLVPKKYLEYVRRDIEKQKELYLTFMQQEDGKKEIRKLFTRMTDVLDAFQKSPDENAFLNQRKLAFPWKSKLAVEYTFKILWYSMVLTLADLTIKK